MDNLKKIIELLEQQGKTLARIEKKLETKEKEKQKVQKQSKQKPSAISKMTTTALLLFLKADGFFDEPRTLNEIVKKLKEESRNVPPTSLTMPLQRLVRSRQLGRILKSGKWNYIKR